MVMANMFQLGEKKSLKRSQKVKQKKMPDPGEEGIIRQMKLTDEAMMNIICDDIVTNTIATALRGEDPPPGPIMELPYAGSQAMLWIKQTWIAWKYKGETYKARRTGPMKIYCSKRYG